MFDDRPVFRTQEEIEAHRRKVAEERESNWIWAVGLVAAFALVIAAFPVKDYSSDCTKMFHLITCHH